MPSRVRRLTMVHGLMSMRSGDKVVRVSIVVVTLASTCGAVVHAGVPLEVITLQSRPKGIRS